MERLLSSSGEFVTLTPEREGCGEQIALSSGIALLGTGEKELSPGDQPGEWLACIEQRNPKREVMYFLLARGRLMIEISAFPESGVSKEELIRLAASLTEVP